MFKEFFVYPLAPAHSNPSPTFSQPLKNNSRSYAQIKIRPFYCTKFFIAPVKDFRLVREMQECTTVFFHRKKTKNNHKNVRKTCY